jgi:hypothetical protein
MALAPNMVGAAALRGTWPHCLDGRDWVDAVVAPSSDTPWDDFWASLERLVNTPKLDGASFVYGAHKLDQQANRIRFQRAVAICSSDTHVCKEDLDRVLCQTEHGYLAEMLDVAMNMGESVVPGVLSVCIHTARLRRLAESGC